MERATFNVPSISCSSCAGKIQNEISSLKGVSNVWVNLKSQVVEVEYNPGDIQRNEIGRKISSMGYEVIH